MRCGIGQHLLKLLSIIIAPCHRPIRIDVDYRVAFALCIFLRRCNLPVDGLLGLSMGRIPRINYGCFIY